MNIQEKLELNKLIKVYNGNNSFMLSLQKQLKTSKFIQKIEYNGKMVKILSDKQYEVAINYLD